MKKFFEEYDSTLTDVIIAVLLWGLTKTYNGAPDKIISFVIVMSFCATICTISCGKLISHDNSGVFLVTQLYKKYLGYNLIKACLMITLTVLIPEVLSIIALPIFLEVFKKNLKPTFFGKEIFD